MGRGCLPQKGGGPGERLSRWLGESMDKPSMPTFFVFLVPVWRQGGPRLTGQEQTAEN